MNKMVGNRVQLFLLRLLAGSLLAGCTAGSVEEIVPEENRPVVLSFGKPDLGVPELLTRAGETVIPSPTPLPAGSTVRIGAYFRCKTGEMSPPISFSTVAPSFEATYVVGSDGDLTPCCVDVDGKQIPGDAQKLVVRGGVFDFYAVSPARSLLNGADGMYGITGILHKEDVMTSFVRDVTVSGNVGQITLNTFCRKCAQVVFNVMPWPGNALPFDQLYGTGLVIKNISSSGASLIAGEDTGILPTGGGTGINAQVTFVADEFELVEPDSDPDGLGLNKTKGVILPKDSQPFDVEITVVRNQETALLRATIDRNITFDAGKRYIFTLEVKNNESCLLMRVLAWNAISFRDDNVGAPDSPYPDPDINEGIGTTVTVARWSEILWSGNGDVGG